jgi:hypothetical protein
MGSVQWQSVGSYSDTIGPSPYVYAMTSWVHAMFRGPMQRRDGFFIVACMYSKVIPTLCAAIYKYRP